jgi:hypothetical protein
MNDAHYDKRKNRYVKDLIYYGPWDDEFEPYLCPQCGKQFVHCHHVEGSIQAPEAYWFECDRCNWTSPPE